MIKRIRRCWPDLRALIIYILVSVAYLWPLVRRFGTEMAGDGFDRYVFQWTNWWVTRALSQGHSPYRTRMMFYPQGVDLYFLSFSWLNTFVWWSLQALIGDPAAYNFTVWWSWPLAGFGAYLLGKEVLGDRRAAFVAGLIYAFYPYHFAQRNHLNLLSIQWIPFSLLFVTRAARRGRWLDGCLAGLFFAFSGLSSWHLLSLSGLLSGLWLGYGWFTERTEWPKKSWRALLAVLVTTVVITGPFLAPLVREQFMNRSGQDPYLGKEEETQTDLVAYVLPNLYHPLWGEAAAPVHRRFLRQKDHAVALGYVPLALIVYGLVRWRENRRARFWLGGLFLFIILALGPFPRINGKPFPDVPLPYRLVGWSLPVRSLRSPGRFNIIVGLCLSLAAAGAVARVLTPLSRRRAVATFVVLSTLVLLEYWSWPFPTRPPDIPVGYQEIADEPGDFAIVDLPISNDLSKQYMYYQTAHGRPTVTGHVSRPPADAYAFIEANDLLSSMWTEQRPDLDGDPVADLAALADAGVGYVAVHKDELKEEDLDVLEAYLPTRPLYSDDRLAIYGTDDVKEQ